MMQVLSRFRALGATDRSLVVEATVLILAARLGSAILPFPVLRKAFDRWARRRRPSIQPSPSQFQSVAWAVSAVARRSPWRSSCLMESLAADAMLRRRGYACTLRFGVRKPQGRVLAAHAWVEHQGVVVFGAIAELSEFAVLAGPDAL